ncbi:hypothetical protein LTR85_005577 [Meristemomyces frigidus]|nr:hypothetical protein LTR85_005577 [Meristemomyces frigidus]
MAKPVASSTLGSPSDTYLYALARIGDCFATIGSDDALRIFDPSLKVRYTAQPRNSGLSCLETFSDNSLATAGRDGVVRLWDTRGKLASQFAEPQGRAISALVCRENVIAVGTESAKEGLGDVSVLLYDTRNPAVPLRNYAESHTDSITQLAFHPTQPNVLLSGSTDGLVSIFDVNQADEEDALNQVLNPRSAVHCAGFLTSDQAYVLTTDEQFLIYPLAEPVEGTEPAQAIDFGDVREKLGCMYVIDLLRQPGGKPVMAYGHNERQTLSIVKLTGPEPWAFGQAVELPGAHGEEVVRDVLLTERRAYSCGEDGQFVSTVWTEPSVILVAVPRDPTAAYLLLHNNKQAVNGTSLLDTMSVPRDVGDNAVADMIVDIASNSQADEPDNELGTRRRGLKRRRVIRDDDDCDDDEPLGDAKLVDTTSEEQEAATEAQQPEQLSRRRLVQLSVKISGTTFTSFYLKEDIIREIPDYSRKLDDAISKKRDGERLRIRDHKIRREEMIAQAIDFLSDGILEPLNTEKSETNFRHLVNLVSLYDIGVLLSIGKLQRAIVDHIAACDGLAPDAFVGFAAECYREGKEGHKVKPDCLLGRFIKTNLADHLPSLVESGAVDLIKEIGGTLNKQLVEVFMENYKVSQAAQKGEYKVKVEIED